MEDKNKPPSPAEEEGPSSSSGEEQPPYDLPLLTTRISEWSKRLKEATKLVSKPGPRAEPFKNIYAATESISLTNFEVDAVSNIESVKGDPALKFWIRFTKVHVLSCLAKWYEMSEELSLAEAHHVQCLDLIENELNLSRTNPTSSLESHLESIQITTPPEDPSGTGGLQRMLYMYIYELTRYAILASQQDNQDKALELLKKAEVFYHDHSEDFKDECEVEGGTILGMLNELNGESFTEIFTYVLFYLGQAHKILGEKERAILYLHMVLRRQLEHSSDYSKITWASDSAKMAVVLMSNTQTYQPARHFLLASTTVLTTLKDEEKQSDEFKENWAELGRTWGKFGVNLLGASADRLKDLEECNSESRMQIKFESKLVLSGVEKKSLGIQDDQTEFDTILLLRDLKFPTLDVPQGVDQMEMKPTFARDFEEARSIFLHTQRWINIAKEYYTLNEFAGDYIGIISDYSLLFKHLAFFEPSLERRIKMHKRRIGIMEDLLKELNPGVYTDVFHDILRELAETYEVVYKLKVDECKDRGKSLRPKDKKLVQWLVDAVGAYKRNLKLFDFDLDNPGKGLSGNEKILLACVLACGRILGSVCHDHPLHSDAADLGEESKRFYQYFLDYLDYRLDLKREFISLYEGSRDMPDLLDNQIRKIRHHHRIRSMEMT